MCSSIQCIFHWFRLQYSWEMYMKTFCSFPTNFSAAFAGRTIDIWRDILIQITVNCFKKKNHAYAAENVMRAAHKSYCVKLYLKMPRIQSLSSIEEMSVAYLYPKVILIALVLRCAELTGRSRMDLGCWLF